MKNVMKRSGLLGALGLLIAVLLAPASATAGVASYGAVLLDPFDPVPEIQFRPGGCDEGCGYRHAGCDDGCSYHRPRCYDGCGHRRPPRCEDPCGYRPSSCNDNCDGYRPPRQDDCDDGCRTAGGPEGGIPPDARPPCEGHCNVTEHWRRDWHNGEHYGQEWYDRGYRERDGTDGHHPSHWHHTDNDNEDFDDPDPPPAPAATPPATTPPAK